MRHGGRRAISQSGIKLAVITVPTKKEPKVKGGAGVAEGDGGGEGSEGGGAAEGEDAGISLDAPQGAEDDKESEGAEGAEGEEEKPIRGEEEEEEGNGGGVITRADEAAELASGA